MTFKVVIAGGRDFNDYDRLCKVCSHLLKDKKDVEIVSGGAKGADNLGEQFANTRGHKLKLFPADWDRYGKSAGHVRNAEMAAYADAVVVFWDGRSRGTKNMIEQAEGRGLPVRIITYDNQFEFFWGNESVFSQWYSCNFQVGDCFYNCMEQYMMAEKAALFKDDETRVKVLNEEDPAKQKALGREVKNFDEGIWDQHKLAIVTTGNYHKFSQNEALKERLLSTGNKIVVEASPYDRIWGIGMSEDHPDVRDMSKWNGQNLLGKALMTVRSTLREY